MADHEGRAPLLPTVTVGYQCIKIHFAGVLHLSLDRRTFLGAQSWVCDERNHSIEYTFVGGSILSEYDQRPVFEHILKELDRLI